MVVFVENLQDIELFHTLAISSVVLILAICSWPSARQLSHIPAVGATSQFWSFIDAFKFVFDARRFLQRGFKEHPEGIFRVPDLDRWLVVIHSPDLIREIRKVRPEVLSLSDALTIVLQFNHTLGHNIHSDPYHITTVRTHLTKNLTAMFPALHREVVVGFQELVPANRTEWMKISALNTMMQIVSRASNSIFVGSSLCRNTDYIDLTVKFALDVFSAGQILRYTPPLLRSLIVNWYSDLPVAVARGLKHLQPLIEERRRGLDKNSPDVPNDFLTWLMEAREGDNDELTRRILTMNFVAIHTTGMSFCHALYYLAAYPEYATVLREEVEEVIRHEGWTHAAIGRMVKVDSFIKESLRLNTDCLSIVRLVTQPFTFSNGVYLPPGTFLAAASETQTDEFHYSNPLSFEPFRYLDKAKKENVGRRPDLTETHADYMPFGIGLNACPGRFFAANELKLMLAILMTNYDVTLEGPRPENKWTGTSCLPNLTAEVLFRRRAA